ncbi:MAG: secondary thiamine-phosphate synthase enzyme YjbQ [Anaerolineaceae bacterium]|nr:secondary thiamine-phosphate synthase enzyme YjbQ [Anaerolineaceae bacterium]
MIVSRQLKLHSDGRFNVINITDQVRDFIASTGLQQGQVCVFFQHTTGAVIIGEHEPGIIADLEDMLDRITPTDYPYLHHIRAVDFNGHAHLRAAILPTSVTIPFIEGSLALGTYQEVLVIDDQVDQEPRYLVLQAMGE